MTRRTTRTQAATQVAQPSTPPATRSADHPAADPAAEPPAPGPLPASPRTRLLAGLGLHGLTHLDAPVLAALATETPLLLIGPHGSAKSALLERLAAALGLEHRHYNASLLSFDDLVGFPVPDGDGLRYLRTPATLWGAQSVFLDEISRCRPEVQNKLFSIVHERRVQGVALDALRYRWAAMNPPAPDDGAATDDDADVYTGSLPLDPALADRFGFVLSLPALIDLPPEDRRRVIRSGLTPSHATPALPGTGLELPGLVARCREAVPLLAQLHEAWITAYTAALIVPLRQAGLAISGRRAAMLAANIAAVHGARRLLGDGEVLDDSAFAALRHSLPQRAQAKALDAGMIATVHRAAVEAAAQAQADATLARILDEAHPVRRVGLALAALVREAGCVPRNTMSALVCDALAAQDRQARWILAQELLPVLAERDCVDAPTLELLAEPFVAQIAYEDRASLRHELARNRIAPFNALVAALGAMDPADPDQVALGNLGAALYLSDEGASRPELLRRQQAALRERLDPEGGHAD